MLKLSTRADLERLIADEVQESLTLDYKASPALSNESKAREELCKDVSAFANSAGGQIVYGIEERDRKPGRSYRPSLAFPKKFFERGPERLPLGISSDFPASHQLIGNFQNQPAFDNVGHTPVDLNRTALESSRHTQHNIAVEPDTFVGLQ